MVGRYLVSVIYIDTPNLLKRITDKKVRKSIHIKNIIDYEKLSRLTKIQMGNINSFLRNNKLFIRVTVKGYHHWEIWYGGES
jgi:hypothetical protein